MIWCISMTTNDKCTTIMSVKIKNIEHKKQAFKVCVVMSSVVLASVAASTEYRISKFKWIGSFSVFANERYLNREQSYKTFFRSSLTKLEWLYLFQPSLNTGPGVYLKRNHLRGAPLKRQTRLEMLSGDTIADVSWAFVTKKLKKIDT
jgi:hypothetical protein